MSKVTERSSAECASFTSKKLLREAITAIARAKKAAAILFRDGEGYPAKSDEQVAAKKSAPAVAKKTGKKVAAKKATPVKVAKSPALVAKSPAKKAPVKAAKAPTRRVVKQPPVKKAAAKVPAKKAAVKAPAKKAVRVVQVVRTPAPPTTEAPTVTTPNKLRPVHLFSRYWAKSDLEGAGTTGHHH